MEDRSYRQNGGELKRQGARGLVRAQLNPARK